MIEDGGGEVAHEETVRVLYRAILGRDADPTGLRYHAERLRRGDPLAAVIDGITHSPEFRERERWRIFAARSARQDLRYQFVIVTGEGLSKVGPVMQALLARLGRDDRLTILSGSAAEEEPPSVDRRVSLHRFAGSSVFHLRAKLPLVAAGAQWMVLLEDHNHPPPHWFDAVDQALSAAAPDTVAVVGPVDNLTSCDAWSWASFLATFAMHWHPLADASPLPLIVGNIAFRTEVLPERELAFGEFEGRLMPRLATRAQTAPAMWVDHVQPLSFRRATASHFHNGRVAGAIMRLTTPEVSSSLKGFVRHIGLARLRPVMRRLAVHPRRAELPPLIGPRLAWLGWATCAGFVSGSLFGAGRSPQRLE